MFTLLNEGVLIPEDTSLRQQVMCHMMMLRLDHPRESSEFLNDYLIEPNVLQNLLLSKAEGLSGEQAGELKVYSEQLSMDILTSYFLWVEEQYTDSIDILMKSGDAKVRESVFSQINRVYTHLKNDSRREEIDEYLSSILSQLTQINSQLTFVIMDYYCKHRLDTYIQVLEHDPMSQMRLLREIILTHGDSTSENMLEIYFLLLARNRMERQFIQDIEKCQKYPQSILKILENDKLYLAVAHMYYVRFGNAQKAIKHLFLQMKQIMH